MLTLPYTVADVFTERALTGNQLAVFTDGAAVPDRLHRPLAREMAFSETVFVLPPERDGDARVRIFTPAEELPFAGHPVLGTAVVLAATTGASHVRLETGAGVVPVRLDHVDAHGGFGWMRQPLPTVTSFADVDPLCRALGVERSVLPVDQYDNGPRHVVVVLDDAAEVAALSPDMAALRALGAVGVTVCAGDGDRWKTRMFAPGIGVPEDAATGSAAGPLGLHLARHGLVAFGRRIEIRQGAEIDRPSRLVAQVSGGPERVEAVEVGGGTVIVAEGAFRLPA